MKKTLLFLTINLIFLATNYLLAQTCQNYIPNEWEDSRYTDNGDGTVTDNETTLMWEKCTQGLSGNDCSIGTGGRHDWKEALQLVNNYSFASHNDWRLPNIKELSSLVARRCSDPSINESAFPNTSASYFLSSSPSASNSSNVWQLHFGEGFAHSDSRDLKNFVRLVRSGQ